MLRVARNILGPFGDDAVVCISNEDRSASDLAGSISDVISEDPSSFFILGTDFPGGSCFIASKKVASKSMHITTVSGFNISMLLSFLTKRDLLSGMQLAETMRTDGNRAIVS
jgi:mannose/fructose-specific phosphotransferase system component IIA